MSRSLSPPSTSGGPTKRPPRHAAKDYGDAAVSGPTVSKTHYDQWSKYCASSIKVLATGPQVAIETPGGEEIINRGLDLWIVEHDSVTATIAAANAVASQLSAPVRFCTAHETLPYQFEQHLLARESAVLRADLARLARRAPTRATEMAIAWKRRVLAQRARVLRLTRSGTRPAFVTFRLWTSAATAAAIDRLLRRGGTDARVWDIRPISGYEQLKTHDDPTFFHKRPGRRRDRR